MVSGWVPRPTFSPAFPGPRGVPSGEAATSPTDRWSKNEHPVVRDHYCPTQYRDRVGARKTGNHRQKTPSRMAGSDMAESLFSQSWARVPTLSLDQLSSWASDYFSETVFICIMGMM